jgi:hypothetical protein
VWKRSEWITDHETGKRRRFERPEADWIRQALPNLAIVSEEVWTRAQETAAKRVPSFERDTATGQVIVSARRASPTRHLLSGFLECASCGGSFFAVTS